MRTDERLHAYIDGELDAAAALELEREMAQNPALRAAAERLRELSSAVRTQADYHRAPRRFKKIPKEKRRWLMLAPAFALALLIGAGIGLYIARPAEDAELVASHVRATLGNRNMDSLASWSARLSRRFVERSQTSRRSWRSRSGHSSR